MSDLRDTLRQLDRTDVPAPRPDFQDALWRELVVELETTTWRDRLRLHVGLPAGRRLVVLAAGAVVGLLLAVAAAQLVDAFRPDEAPPVIGDPGPATGELPPFRMQVEVTSGPEVDPSLVEPVVLTLEIAYDGGDGLRQELLAVDAADTPLLASLRLVLTDGDRTAHLRDLSVLPGLAAPADGGTVGEIGPQFLLQPPHLEGVNSFTTLDLLSWERSWSRTCAPDFTPASIAGRSARRHLCTDWADRDFSVVVDAETGLLLEADLPAGATTGLVSPWVVAARFTVTMLVLDATVDEDAFALVAPEGVPVIPWEDGATTTTRAPALEPSRTMAPFRLTIHETLELVSLDLETGEVIPRDPPEFAVTASTWEWSGPDAWRVEERLVQDAEGFDFRPSTAIWDGAELTVRDPDSGEFRVAAAPSLPPSLAFAAGSYFPQLFPLPPLGDLESMLAGDDCVGRGDTVHLGRPATSYTCQHTDPFGDGREVELALLVDAETRLVVDLSLEIDGAQRIRFEVVELEADPTFEPDRFVFTPGEPDRRVAGRAGDDPFAADATGLDVGTEAPVWASAATPGSGAAHLSLQDLRGAPAVILVMSTECRVPEPHCEALSLLRSLADDPTHDASLVWIDPSETSTAADIADRWGHDILTVGLVAPSTDPLPGPGTAWRVDPTRASGGWPLWVVLDGDGVVTYLGSGVVPLADLRAAIDGP